MQIGIHMTSSNFTEARCDEGLMLCPEELSTASSEERVVHSYDRFFKAVSQVTTRQDVDTTTPIPTLERVLVDFPSLPESTRRELETVWSRAQRFVQLQKLVEKFQEYRHDLVRRLQERSRPFFGSQSSMDRDDGMKELRMGQSRLEEQLHFTNAILIGMEQRYDQIPTLLAELTQKMDKQRDNHEQTTLRRQMDRMEQRLVEMDARLPQWSKAESGMAFASATWPDTLHNNIVYSSSSEGCSSEGQREVTSAVAEDETPETDHTTAVPVELSEGLKSDGVRESGSDVISNFEEEHVSCTTTEAVTSLPNTEAASNKTKLDVSKQMSHKEREEKKSTVHDTPVEEQLLSGDFDEVFLEDALVVQENILTSSLGQSSSRVPKRRSRRVTPPVGPETKSDQSELSNKGQSEMEDRLVHLLGVDSISFLSSSFSEFCMSGYLISEITPDT